MTEEQAKKLKPGDWVVVLPKNSYRELHGLRCTVVGFLAETPMFSGYIQVVYTDQIWNAIGKHFPGQERPAHYHFRPEDVDFASGPNVFESSMKILKEGGALS